VTARFCLGSVRGFCGYFPTSSLYLLGVLCGFERALALWVVGPSFFAPVFDGHCDPVTGRSRWPPRIARNALVARLRDPLGPFLVVCAFRGFDRSWWVLIGDGLDGAPGQDGGNGGLLWGNGGRAVSVLPARRAERWPWRPLR